MRRVGAALLVGLSLLTCVGAASAATDVGGAGAGVVRALLAHRASLPPLAPSRQAAGRRRGAAARRVVVRRFVPARARSIPHTFSTFTGGDGVVAILVVVGLAALGVGLHRLKRDPRAALP